MEKKKFIYTSELVKGFSLIELLISLIIISCVIAAFAPIMTKKLSSHKIIGANSKNDSQGIDTDKTNRMSVLLNFGNSSAEGLFNCNEIDSTKTECTFKVPDKVKSLSAILVAGGAGGAGAVDSKEDETVFVGNVDSEMVIKDGFDKMSGAEVILIGSGGGGGLSVAEPTIAKSVLEQKCSSYGTKYAENIYSSKLIPVCIMTSNAGAGYYFNYNTLDISYLASSTRQTNYNTCNQSRCCWSGVSPVSIVCTREAGNTMCRNFAPGDGATKGQWTMIDRDFASALTNISISDTQDNEIISAVKSLNMCSSISDFTNKGVAKCSFVMDSCWGTYTEDCTPHYYYEKGGSLTFRLGERGHQSTYGKQAASVRCTLRLQRPFNSYGGGGGGAGVAISIKIPNNIIQQAGKITLKSGKAAQAQEDGKASEIVIYDKTELSKKIWGYRAHGGHKGNDAVIGLAGMQNEEQDLCDVIENNEWVLNKPCSEIPNAKVSIGTKGYGGETKLAQDGTAVLDILAKAGERYDGIFDKNYNNYGKGGAGGQLSIKGESQTPGAGKNGFSQLSYKRLYKGASGGGGGGGCVAKIENIKVIPNETLKIIIGNGGKGGKTGKDNINAENGTDGYNTKIENAAKTLNYTVIGGKGGKIGKIANTIEGSPTLGIGGEGGQCLNKNNNKTNNGIIRISSSGVKGESGIFDSKNSGNYLGGFGGISGFIGTLNYPYLTGGCGGLSLVSGCNNTSINGLQAIAIDPTNYPFPGEDYGLYGAGGGGGGLKIDTPKAGSGGSGLAGYVYLYWTKPKEENNTL